jgi:hypothetical protein
MIANNLAQLLDFLTNVLLRKSKPFPSRAEFKHLPAGAHQHHFSGTGYREEVITPDEAKGEKILKAPIQIFSVVQKRSKPQPASGPDLRVLHRFD